MSEAHPDVLVIGGGPAGSTAARLLVEWGHGVTLVAKADGRPNLGQSLPPSIEKLLKHVGIDDAVGGGGFLRTAGNTVWWGDEEGRSEPFPGGAEGYQIESARFEDLLIDAARQANVNVVQGAVREAKMGSGAAEVRLDGGADLQAIYAPWVLDCSGRSGVLAKQGLRRAVEGRRTVALARVWQSDRHWDLPDPTHTLVESYEDGWAWSVPVSATRRHVTVMVDPAVTDLARDADIARMYDAELAKASRIHQISLGGSSCGEPFACGASPYAATRTTGDGFLLVGDAASFIDPLSSFGVKKAFVSGWMAAVVANTCLRNEAMRSSALALYDRREQEAYSSLVALSDRFYRAAADTHDHPFWLARGEAVGDAPSDLTSASDVQLLKTDSAVLTAFEELKEARTLRLRATPEVSLAPGPAVQGREVVLEEQLISPWMPGGIRFLREIDLPALVRMAPDFEQVPDLFDAYNARHAPAILPDFLGVLSVLLAKGLLRNETAD